jgi:hypothetical protein
MTDPALTECEKCGGTLKKILYPVGISFKGDGFYVTDYKGAGKEPKVESASTEAKAESKPTEAKTEAKPTETKSETKATETKTT